MIDRSGQNFAVWPVMGCPTSKLPEIKGSEKRITRKEKKKQNN